MNRSEPPAATVVEFGLTVIDVIVASTVTFTSLVAERPLGSVATT